ncbi:MAG: beta-N-acetylglucosaminidase domain-containing protein [Proteobacteria bacterium]|nr:beta-N-acetylglucosaminidase domain-containing protein [Pseudomonadota bacterium]
MPSDVEGFSYGLIEGFYGEPWSWQAREDYAPFLKTHGFRFYIYAPKADEYLRRNWRADWPDEEWEALERLRAHYRSEGVLFGIGFTPYGIQSDYGADEKAALERKVKRIDALKPDILALLFDDVPGIDSDLASRQIPITHDAIAASGARSFLFCPTYYSDDPIFEAAFGTRPRGHLEELGKGLDPAIGIFWTGPRICSKEYTESHLADVAERLDRKPFIWDNYPVNDGPEMCKHLYIRAVTGRSHRLSEWTAGLAANPMIEAELSKIPLATLAASFERKDAYDPEGAFREAASRLFGPELAAALEEDRALFHDTGLDGIDAARKEALKERYARLESPAAREIVRWLEGSYAPPAEVVAEWEGWGA